MLFGNLTPDNQQLIMDLDGMDPERRKNISRHYNVNGTWKPRQHCTDPATGKPRARNVTVWEFEVDPFTHNQDMFRLIRRGCSHDIIWYWAIHTPGNQFRYDKIEGYARAARIAAPAPPPTPPQSLSNSHQLAAEVVTLEGDGEFESWEDR